VSGEIPLTSRSRRSVAAGVPPVDVDVAGGRVTVLSIGLPLRGETGPLVPRLERFAHFTLDQRTAEVLEKLATAVQLGEPCLLEGETSTSKTSSIEYLAALTWSPLVRLNLSGQTDTSELIGKFVPNDGRLSAGWEELLRDAGKLTPASREVLERARAEGRGLSLVESRRIGVAEGLRISDWRWQDGAVPDAMIRGRWLILDEINLAEPQVLERLNPVVERHPTLVVSENGGFRIGPGGDSEVHRGFHLFATMNPADYAGRSPMSPAYKDRFTAYKFVAAPTETEYAEMLVLMVFGEQPRFTRDGTAFGGQRVDPLFPRLSGVAGVRGLLRKLAKLHATVEGMARKREIGKDARERIVYSRRTLIELLGYLDKVAVVDRSTGESRGFETAPKEIFLRALRYYYLDKLAREEDAQKVVDQLDAIGISERQWEHELGGPAAPPRPAPPRRDESPRPLATSPAATVTSASEGPPRRQIVPLIGGGTALLSDLLECGGFQVGDLLRLLATVPEPLRKALGDPPRLEVTGVTPDGKVVVEAGSGRYFRERPEKLRALVEKLP
jgi:MoxR-like ATPase